MILSIQKIVMNRKTLINNKMNIGIVGLGLIGGSIGLKLQKYNHIVYGLANNATNKEKALERKLANHVSCDPEILKECNLIILALPIKDLINPSSALVKAIPPDSVLTDVGSIKLPIIKTWEKLHPCFIGSHPMAGNELKGVNSGNEELLSDAKWIITPTIKSNKKAIKQLSELIISIGCELCNTSPKEHDQAVALISHLPIFIASTLVETVNIKQNNSLLELAQKLASTGFADTSRVGGGNPQLGVDIATNNQTYLLEALKSFKENINILENLIIEKDWDSLLKRLHDSKEYRTSFCK